MTPKASRRVEAFWSYTATRPGRTLVLPDGRCDIIIRFDGAGRHAPEPIVTGPATSAYTVTYETGDSWLGMRLRPDQGVTLWKHRIGLAANSVLRGEAALSLAPPLALAKFDDLSLGAFGTVCEDWLSCAATDAGDDRVLGLLDVLHASGGRIKVDELAMHAGCTTRQLNRIFRNHIGIPVKTYAQIIRFHRTLRLIQIDRLPIISAALEGGYCDQAHLSRAWRRFCGFAPSAAPDELSLPTLFS